MKIKWFNLIGNVMTQYSRHMLTTWPERKVSLYADFLHTAVNSIICVRCPSRAVMFGGCVRCSGRAAVLFFQERYVEPAAVPVDVHHCFSCVLHSSFFLFFQLASRRPMECAKIGRQSCWVAVSYTHLIV